MRMRIGPGRAVLFTASLLVLASGAAVAGNGVARAATASPAALTQAARPAVVVNTITVTAPANQASPPGAPVTPVTATAVDSGALPVTWTAAGLPAGLAIGAATGTISGTPTVADETGSPFTVTVTASDASGGTGSAAFTWTIALNTITVTPPANQTTPPKTAVSLQVEAVDSAAGQALAYSATGLPGGLAINAATGLISGTTTTADIGPHTVVVTVTNATSTPATATFTWSVALNKIAVTAPATEQSRVGIAVRLQITATDAEAGQPLTYTTVNLPPGLAVNHATGLISGTPNALFGKATTVIATDPTGSAGSAVIRWKVGAVIAIPDPGGQVLYLGQPVDIPLTVRDNAARDTLTLRVSGLPLGVNFQHRPPVLSGWPVTARTYHVVVTARGADGGVAVLTFPVRVRPARDAGPAGAIQLDIAGKCLDDLGNRSANGARVDIWSCNGGAAQRWTLAEDGTVRVHGKCLQVVGGGVRLQGCTAAPAQTWVKGTDAELVNPASGHCLADPGSSTRNGTRPVLAACAAQPGERWVAPGGPLLAGLMGSCADDHYSSGVNGNVIDVFACNGSTAQSWQLLTDGTMRIFGNKCMTVAGAAGRIGSKIELYTCAAGNARQHWRIVTHGTFTAEIENGGACLAVPSNTSAAGTQLRLERCPGTVPGGGWHDW